MHPTGASSSSWEGPLTETQAVHISDYLLTDQEAQVYLSEYEEEGQEQPERGPAWERIWFSEYDSDRFPADLSPYGPETYGAYWEKWLAEVIRPPPPGHYDMQNEAILAKRDARDSE